MNQVTKPAFTLPADFGDRLMAGIADTRSTLAVGGGGGKPFLRLLKSGLWVFGPRNEPVQEGAIWAVNLATLQRGWVCWGEGELLGQTMASVQAPRLDQPPPVKGIPFEEQFSMELTCIDGAHKGLTVIYKNNSYGFKTAFDKLTGEIQAQFQADKRFFWPVIELYEEDYDHKRYGQTWNPILVITAWADADGNLQGEAAPAPEPAPAPVQAAPAPAPEPAPAPRRRRTPPQGAGQPAQEASPPVAPVAPVSTQQAHAGQRRRPAR